MKSVLYIYQICLFAVNEVLLSLHKEYLLFSQLIANLFLSCCHSDDNMGGGGFCQQVKNAVLSVTIQATRRCKFPTSPFLSFFENLVFKTAGFRAMNMPLTMELNLFLTLQ